MSFSLIEHGILRRSKWLYGLGYIGKIFPNRIEKMLRVDEQDYRIHFALNCGAKDCPPVAIYSPSRIKDQLEKATKGFLNKTTEYNQENNQVEVTALFSWFRGDFGGKKGIIKILRDNEILDAEKNITLSFKSYDWTLNLDNYIDF
jgi:hypothetical protein